VQGGLSTGKSTTDNCEIRALLPEIAAVNPYCHVESPFLTQVKFLGTYTVPKVDLQVAATYQNLPGSQILANFIASNAVVQPSLGRPLSGGAANVTVNIVRPGSLYIERLSELDLRFSKILRLGRTKTALNLDLYNAFNSSALRTVDANYGTWQRPTGILDARLFKISAQFDF
jgi:hypothetical protein